MPVPLDHTLTLDGSKDDNWVILFIPDPGTYLCVVRSYEVIVLSRSTVVIKGGDKSMLPSTQLPLCSKVHAHS